MIKMATLAWFSDMQSQMDVTTQLELTKKRDMLLSQQNQLDIHLASWTALQNHHLKWGQKKELRTWSRLNRISKNTQ
jgi:hypothetical protein